MKNQKNQTVFDFYPFNLTRQLFAEDEEAMSINITGLNQVLAELPEKERCCLKYKYQNNATLVSIGHVYGVSSGSIHQTISKTLRKLRHPKNLNRIRACSYQDVHNIVLELDKLKRDYQDLQNAFEDIGDDTVPVDTTPPDISTMTIEHLDLTVRSYNSLKRANIHTIGDLTQRSLDDLAKVRNLGAKSIQEILSKLAGMNIYLECHDLEIAQKYAGCHTVLTGPPAPAAPDIPEKPQTSKRSTALAATEKPKTSKRPDFPTASTTVTVPDTPSAPVTPIAPTASDTPDTPDPSQTQDTQI